MLFFFQNIVRYLQTTLSLIEVNQERCNKGNKYIGISIFYMLQAAMPEKPKAADRSARRREKSRDAARCRRQQESDTFNEICKVIPVPANILSQMDRSMVMRLLISFMKLREAINPSSIGNMEGLRLDSDPLDDREYVDALNGFVMILSHDFDILFVTSNVKQYIGIANLDSMGQNLFGYSHEGDRSEITKLLKESTDENTKHSFFMRMKSTLTSTGKNVNLKSALYKVLKCEAVVHQSQDEDKQYMVVYCEPIPHPTNIEMVLDCNTFLSQHTLDMKFTYCNEDRLESLLKYSEDDMLKKSFYDFCHTEDVKSLEDSFKKLFRLGQVTTNKYRLLVKSGGYVWVVTEATVINNPRNQQPSYVVCVHYVVSEVIDECCILSLSQMKFVEENTQKMPELEEITEKQVVDCTESIFDNTESIFCDSTNSIFLPETDACESFLDATDDIFLPCTESLEAMANNAPSIGDEIEFDNFPKTFTIDEEMFKNAPSIGDPDWDIQKISNSPKENKGWPEATVNVDRVKGYLKNKIANGCRNQPEIHDDPHQMNIQPERNSSPPGLMKRKLPRDGQIIFIPKSQYQKHVSLKDINCYKIYPPDDSPVHSCYSPLKKRRTGDAEDSNVSSDEEYCVSHLSPSNSEHTWPLQTETMLLEASLCSPVEDREKYCCPYLGSEDGSGGDSDCSWPEIKREHMEKLPVLSLKDCEVNAPVEDNVTTIWTDIASVLEVA